MKRIAPVVVVVVIFATGASSHKSGWMESFDAFGEGYSYGKDVLPAPWEGAVSMIAGAKLGRDDTAGAQGPGRGWSWGHAFRPATDIARIEYQRAERSARPDGQTRWARQVQRAGIEL